ncbi:hypothetical protein CC80DRAFT_548274 [Byssothecium circinans]|uniref:Concanavalin A-like lectin/glucanase n=1 Tax=Byssothecium circinans TaxID=147558 RepID=A0A6A5TXI0_9PLEO|nr:hypothetical protein CC80DRAFT_548274 [Byssothecium circinans]
MHPTLPTLILSTILITTAPHTSALALNTLQTMPTTHYNHASPPASPNLHLPRAPCTPTNLLQNPAFESGAIAPWAVYATGSWAQRGISKEAPHDGTYGFYAVSNSTNASTLSLTQYNIGTRDIVSGGRLRVSMWCYVGGGMGAQSKATFTVFLDERVVGERVLQSRGEGGVWSEMRADLSSGGEGGMITVTVVADAGGVMGEEVGVGVDDLWVLKAKWGGQCIMVSIDVLSNAFTVTEDSRLVPKGLPQLIFR